MPTRLLRESIRQSETLDRIGDFAERLFFRLTVTADDFGRFRADPRVVLADCFPLRVGVLKTDRVAAALDELVGVNLIHMYTVDNRRYGQFVTWQKHQRVRARFSKFPAQTADNCQQIAADGGTLPQDVLRESRVESRESRETSARNSPQLADNCRAWLDVLNAKTGRSFRPVEAAVRHIRARLAEGFGLADAERVVVDRVARWAHDPKMVEYLRPETVFGTKFSSYLEAAKTADDLQRPYMGPGDTTPPEQRRDS